VPKLFAIVPGFGEPHAAHKEDILRNNLAVLSGAFPDAILRVCCYTPGYRLPDDIARGVEGFYEPGIIVQFLLKYAHPEELAAKGATHVAIVLDDVELLPGVEPLKMLRVLRACGAQVASPVLPSTPRHVWKFMMRDESRPPGSVVRATCAEMFFFLMTLDDWRRYFAGFDVANPWGWGVELTMHRLRGLRALLFNDMVVKHWYSGGGAKSTAALDEAAYYRRRGLTKKDVMAQQRLELMNPVPPGGSIIRDLDRGALAQSVRAEDS
jgi:hypothetical protein